MKFYNDYKRFLGLSLDANYEKVAEELEKRVNSISKPCWELEYCPYGPLVEEFPIPPINRQTGIEDKEYAKYISTGLLGSGESIDDETRKRVENKVNDFNPEDSSEAWSQFEIDGKCKIFGHFCPVFFVKESVAEVKGDDAVIDRIIEDIISDE